MLERQQAAEKQAGQKATAAGTAASMQLTPDELSELLNEAIRQSGQAEVRRDQALQMTTLDDALAIAREAGIDQDHVLAAANELQRRKQRAKRREIVRSRRRAAFFAWFAVAAAATALMGFGTHWGGLVTLVVMGLPLLYLGWRWLAAPITDEEADRVDLPPVPGTCRVCGRPAYSPQATFCEEHRYKGPAAG